MKAKINNNPLRYLYSTKLSSITSADEDKSYGVLFFCLQLPLLNLQTYQLLIHSDDYTYFIGTHIAKKEIFFIDIGKLVGI